MKKKETKTFIESHRTCALAKGNTCMYWKCSHRELYKDIESEHDYEFFRYEVPILVRQSNKERMEQSGGHI